MSREQVAKLMKDSAIRLVDPKFVERPGVRQFGVLVTELDGDAWEQGLGFDSSSVCGFQKMEES